MNPCGGRARGTAPHLGGRSGDVETLSRPGESNSNVERDGDREEGTPTPNPVAAASDKL